MRRLIIGFLAAAMLCCAHGFAQTFQTDAVAFVLTNEGEDRMIDRLASAGCVSLYDALLYLRSNLPPTAPQMLTDRMDKLIDSLNMLHGVGEVFDAYLYNFAGPANSPVGICSDGAFIRSDFSVLSYDWLSGFTRYIAKVNFTYPISVADYVYLGSMEDDLGGGIIKETRYMAFAIAWDDSLSTGITERIEKGIDAYPNPASDFIDAVGIEVADCQSVKIYNAFGESVSAFTIELIDSDRIRININRLPAGFYVLKSTAGAKSFIKIDPSR